jgi:uncharacterized RDD family membrane protein YckC
MTLQSNEVTLAGTLRQVGAAVYDGLLILAVFMVVTFIPVAMLGHDLSATEIGPVWHAIHQACLVVALSLYYGYAWTRRGQTLGMKAWKIRIVSCDKHAVTWTTSLVRLMVAAALWLTAVVGILDYMHRHDAHSLLAITPLIVNYLVERLPGRRTLTDRLSKTQILRE